MAEVAGVFADGQDVDRQVGHEVVALKCLSDREPLVDLAAGDVEALAQIGIFNRALGQA